MLEITSVTFDSGRKNGIVVHFAHKCPLTPPSTSGRKVREIFFATLQFDWKKILTEYKDLDQARILK